MLSSSDEVSSKGAIEKCFVGIDAKSITQKMTRRMSVCLQMAGWISNGRFTTGERRNQARYVRGPEAGPVSDGAPEESSNHDF